ncbi:hypothetical protein [Psychrobacter urativorans]|uniref:hypothetical protein n=1 Tax=Psychrobacter urativorans TaxID=45610 RepID=UPI0019196149|nr:hypothetical protein [Psychrobacter urativorans]
MNRSYLKGSLALGVALLLSNCSNVTPLTNISNQKEAGSDTQAIIIPVKQTPSISVNWQNVEASADQFYQNAPTQQSNLLQKQDSQSKVSFIEKSYAKAFRVSVAEAKRRLVLQAISSGILEAVQKDLGDAFVEAYYINDDPDEFRVGITTLNTVSAERYVYEFKQSGLENVTLPIYVYPISGKTMVQIRQLIEDSTPEIFKRYPDTQHIAYNPITSKIEVALYFEPSQQPNDTDSQRITDELSQLVSHPVVVEFWESRVTTL